MGIIKAEHINPIFMSGLQMLKNACQLDAKIGAATAKEAHFSDNTVVIMIGITGEMKGQVMLAFAEDVACEIASKMCMMPIEQLDDLSLSAICELGNMIMGNAATLYSTNGIGIDITPPTICRGNMHFSSALAKNICVPLILEDGKAVEINITVKTEQA